MHEHHGIESVYRHGAHDGGRFRARFHQNLRLRARDFLYVPATSLDLISKYIGGGDNERVRLNNARRRGLEQGEARAKAVAKESLPRALTVGAERAKVKGYAFPPDDAWQREFEEDFPYEETDDQLRCIAEIKDDMQSGPSDGPPGAATLASARPMSRCVP